MQKKKDRLMQRRLSKESKESTEPLLWVRIPPPAPGQEPTALRVLRVVAHLKAKGLRDSTLEPLGKRLLRLSRYVDLEKPEDVKQYISEQSWSESYKHNIVNAYNHYVEFHGLSWQRPVYKRIDRIRKVPREAQINKVIAHARLKYALAYSIMRDTGLRPVEYTWLHVRDIDLESGLLYPGTAKLGAGRVLKVRSSTLAMLKRYIQKEDLGENDVLQGNLKLLCLNWQRLRNSVAKSLGEPELKSIRLYDLRHHFATVLYQKTKDIVYVQRQLGHRRLQHTLRYIHHVNLDTEEYTVKVSSTVEESTPLLEQGFSFIGIIEDKYVFRKPKTPSFSNLLFLF